MGYIAVVNGEVKEALIFPKSARDREYLWWKNYLARTGRELKTFSIVEFIPRHLR